MKGSKKDKKRSSKRARDEPDEAANAEVSSVPRSDASTLLLDTTVRNGDRYVKVSAVASKPQEVARYGVPLTLEVTRHWNVKTLRDSLGAAFTAAGVPMRQSLCDAWLNSTVLDTTRALEAGARLADFDLERDEENAPKAQDAVVPALLTGLERLRATLVAAELGHAADAIVAAFEPELRQRVKLMAIAIRKHTKPQEQPAAMWADHRVTVGRVTVPLREAYRDKLRQLYAMFAQRDAEGFDEALAALVLRYDGFGGGLSQCSLPPLVFEVLRLDFGVFMECFASPLNAHFPRYCSPFADTDFAFGSLGSFFDLRPLEGSFEAHPPPSAAVVQAMVEHMEDLLRMSKKPLSFCVFLTVAPVDSPLRALVQQSPLCVAHETVPARQHFTTEGVEHRRKDSPLKLCVVDSSLLWLQNEGGQRRWPVTPFKVARLMAAFRGLDPATVREENVVVAAAAPPPPPPPPPVVEVPSVAAPPAPKRPVSSNWKQLQAQMKERK